jgi:sulfatase maturation enzyme AslB (radical SAM superfamily)
MNSKFCSLKHYQKVFTLHLNTAASCCRAYPEPLTDGQSIHEKIIQWKNESELLTQGIEIPGCDSCWNDEKQNKLSRRQQEGSTPRTGSRVEILLSNLCNQMCSYCSPRYSSVWEDSIVKHGFFNHVSNTVNANLTLPDKVDASQDRLSEIYEHIQTCEDNSVSLALLGGEPLMQIQNLQTLLSFSQPKIKNLSIVTNLNPPKNKFLKWLVNNFPQDKLRITVSLDATPEFNHVSRAGFDHARFLENLKLLEDHQIDFNFSSTISAISIFDLPNFLSWIDEHQYSVHFHLLNNPDCLNPEVVPLSVRQEILKNIKTNVPLRVDQILNHSQQQVDLKLFEQYNYLMQYFNRVSIDPTKTNNTLFNNYWQWLTKKFSK